MGEANASGYCPTSQSTFPEGSAVSAAASILAEAVDECKRGVSVHRPLTRCSSGAVSRRGEKPTHPFRRGNLYLAVAFGVQDRRAPLGRPIGPPRPSASILRAEPPRFRAALLLEPAYLPASPSVSTTKP